MHFGGIEDDRKDSTAPHITFKLQLGGHRQCSLAICTFHLGFSLVIEAGDGVDTRYIAMEVSFTANLRDCDWAVRNAGLITRFTGKPAQAATASVRNNRDATEAVESGAVESGAVYWHPPLEDRTPSPA